MHYAILAYHADDAFENWSEAEDAALMDDLLGINDRLVAEKHLGPAARLGPTEGARTLRGKSTGGSDMVVDGPFAETKEQLLGFYVVDYPSIDGAIEAAREMRRVNPTAIYEIRPVMLYLPGAKLAGGD
ncbi:MAG: YciI family protein [Hyphomicrobiales bacterium]|nr:YciI family protein [Hyphomicrobiales bacterium]